MPSAQRTKRLPREKSDRRNSRRGATREASGTGPPALSSDLQRRARGDGVPDQLDHRIIDLFRSDPRLPILTAARALDVTPATVRRRLDRLMAVGTVQFLTAVSPERLGYSSTVLIGLQVDLRQSKEIARALSEMDEITFAAAVAGSFDFILGGVFHAEDDLYSFLTEKLARVDGIRRSETFRVLRISKRTVNWGVPLHVHGK